MTSPEGSHLILDIWLGSNIEFRKLKNMLAETLMAHKQLILGFEDWEFYPRGESGVFLIATSHCSVHTYPEFKYLTIDVYSCDKNFDADKFKRDLLKRIELYTRVDAQIIHRGRKKKG